MTTTLNVTINYNGNKFLASPEQALTLRTLIDANAGGFATVRGYESTSNRTSPEIADLTVMTRFSTARLYERRIAALNDIDFDTLAANDFTKVPKLAGESIATLRAAFDKRKADMVQKLQNSLDGVRDTAQHEAHDRCYASIVPGVRVHYVTALNNDGIKMPVLDAETGLPMADSIMMNVVVIKKNVTTEGVYKTVNSGVPVLIGNILESKLPKTSKFKALSLKPGKFGSIAIAGNVLTEAEVARDF